MNKFTVYKADGSVDVFTSVELYRKALERWEQEERAANEKIQKAVDKVLRLSPTRVALSKLINMALVEMGTKINEYERDSKAVETFVKANTSSDESRKRYSAQKGKSGGYFLTPPESTPPATPPSESD